MPDLESGVYYYKAIVWNFQGISLPAIIQSLRPAKNMSKYPTAPRAFIASTNSDIFFLWQSARCCPFLKFLVCPDLEREVGKHYIRELVYVLGFIRGLHVIYKDDMAPCVKDLHVVSDVYRRFANQATI